MAKRAASPQTKALGKAGPRWPHGRTWVLAGFFLPAFAGTSGAFPRLLPEPRAIWATVAVHDGSEEPRDYQRQEGQGFSLEVPKGWLRSEGPGVVRFGGPSAGLRVRTVALQARPGSLDALGAASSELKQLEGGKPAKLRRVKEVSLPAGHAILVKFRINPEPVVDPLSSLECSVYVFPQPGRLQVLSVWSPTASDHRTLRQRVSESLRWK